MKTTARLREAERASGEGHDSETLIFFHWRRRPEFFSTIAVSVRLSVSFEEMVDTVLVDLFGQHPMFETIRWRLVEWSLDNRLLRPQWTASLSANGFRRASLLSFDSGSSHLSPTPKHPLVGQTGR